jgi:CO dehydrogenase nickel-insertion accessory protein CooC1
MLIFIDESGDSGFKINKGSSTHFIIALIIFDDNLDAEETALKIKRLRKKLNKSDNFEFKFNKCNKEFRVNFLNAIKDCSFRIRATVFSKAKISDKNLKSSKNNFYNFALKQSLKYSDHSILQATLRRSL